MASILKSMRLAADPNRLRILLPFNFGVKLAFPLKVQ